MGQLIKVDTSNPDLLKKRVFKVVSPDTYTFEVANDLKVEPAKSSQNQIVKIQLRVLDDGEFKGEGVFDTLVISADPETRKKCEWKTAQFAVACGVCQPEDINNIGEIDLSEFKGRACRATTGVKTTTNPTTQEEQQRAYVKQYLFETEEAASE